MTEIGNIRLTRSLLYFLWTLFIPFNGMAQDFRGKLDRLMQDYESLNWSGVLYAGNKDTVLYKKAIGLADHSGSRKIGLNSLFKTESAGKMFTAVRILQLAAEGKLDLEQNIAGLLPEWKIPNADSIRIRHLLTHTSGLSSPWEHPDYVFGKLYSPAEIKKIIEEAPVIFTSPGEKSYYSNSGYILLEEIISKLAKKPFTASVREHIFERAGMKFTRPLGDSVLPADAAFPSYQVTSDRFAADDTRYGYGQASGAGGWMSTAGDMFRFAQAYLREQLLPRKWMDIQVTNNHTLDSSSAFRRLGMAVLKEKFPGSFIIGHNGGGKGFTTDVYFDYYKGQIVVWCSNMYGTAYELTGKVFAIFNQQEPAKPVPQERIRLAEWALSRAGHSTELNKAVLDSLGIVQPREFSFFAAFDNLTLIGEHAAAALIIRGGRAFFPGAVYIWIKSGENALQLNQKKEASAFFEKAATLALEQKDSALAEQIRKKIEGL